MQRRPLCELTGHDRATDAERQNLECRRAMHVCAVVGRRPMLVIRAMLMLFVARTGVFMAMVALGPLHVVVRRRRGRGLVMDFTIPKFAREGFARGSYHCENQCPSNEAASKSVHSVHIVSTRT